MITVNIAFEKDRICHLINHDEVIKAKDLSIEEVQEQIITPERVKELEELTNTKYSRVYLAHLIKYLSYNFHDKMD